MSKAWKLRLPPSKKLLLLAMCDWANDIGQCFPSMNTIARKTGVSKRQSQRIMGELIAEKYIFVIANKLGGAKPRRYQLNISGHGEIDSGCTGDKLSPVVSAPCLPVTPASRAGAINVIRTTNTHHVDPSLLRKRLDDFDWTYLSALQHSERLVVVNFLSGVDESIHQDILDELAGAQRAKAIKGQWPAWLKGVARRAEVGAFAPNHALLIQRERQHRLVLAEEAAKRLDRERLESERKNDPAARARNDEAVAAALVALRAPMA